MKTLLTALLAFAISASHSFAQTPPDTSTNRVEIAPAVIVLVVGGVVLIGINKLVDRVLPAQTNAPVVTPPAIQPKGLRQFTNADGTISTYPHNHRPGDGTVAMNMAEPIAATDISALGYVDRDADVPTPIVAYWALDLQTSTGSGWSSACTVTGYLSAAGTRFEWWTNSVLATATYAPSGMPGHYGNVDLGFDAPHRMFRVKNCLAR